MLLLLSFGIAYLIGSLSSAILLSKSLGYVDPRSMGSGNAGATNVSRIAGKKVALLVFLLDFFKGFLPLFYLCINEYSNNCQAFAAIGVVLGHILPIYHQFKGGKGVATILGVYTGYQPILVPVILLIWGMTVFVSRYVSLASLATVCLLPLFLPFGFSISPVLLCGLSVASAMVVMAHRENLVRLWQGEEPKIGR